MNWARMNWARMNWALGSRGEVTLWIDEAVLSSWRASGGKGKVHSDAAILCAFSNHAAVLAREARPVIPPRSACRAGEKTTPPHEARRYVALLRSAARNGRRRPAIPNARCPRPRWSASRRSSVQT
jgi:hypothetical protein